jgi:transcriptional antiterminator RfaH
MSAGFWGCLQIEHRRVQLALSYLALKQFETYYPCIQIQRRVGRNIGPRTEPLFRGYSFVRIFEQWHEAHWAPGVISLILDGERPARVPDQIIDRIKAQEVNGLVVLPKVPGLKRGDKVQITQGPFNTRLAIYQGMRSGQRVEVLLMLFGGQQRVELPKADVRPVT